MTTYSPIAGSCDNLGSWTIPDPYFETICRNRGCFVAELFSEYRCMGTPCCSYYARRDPLLCSKERICTCDPGFALVDGRCAKCERLRCYHPGCASVNDSRDPDCMAAMHRFCYMNSKGQAAYPQEIGVDEFGLLCTGSTWYGEVAYSHIPNCLGNTQSASCYSSAHRYCDSIGRGGAGIIQEQGDGVVGLACVPTSWYETVKIAEFAMLHDRCNSPALGQNPACLSAAHRYCTSHGLGSGGVITELGQDEVALGCITEAKYEIVKYRTYWGTNTSLFGNLSSTADDSWWSGRGWLGVGRREGVMILFNRLTWLETAGILSATESKVQ